MQNEEPKDKQENDLYLKGLDYKTRKAIDFNEEIRGVHHTGGGDHRWTMKIFKSGTTRLLEVGRDEYEDGNISCGNGTFDVTDWNIKGGDEAHWTWEKAVAEVPFSLVNYSGVLNREGCCVKVV